MATNTYKTKTIGIILVAIAIAATEATTGRAEGSGSETDCAAGLSSCVGYLNATTTPPQSCCGPLKNAVLNQKACLCSLYNTPGFSSTINITQAMNLPVICKIPTTASPSDFCKGVTPGSQSSNSSSTPSGGSSSGTGHGSGSNSAATITGTVFVSSLLMLVTYVVVY